jgi:twitching motility protein PilT
MDAARPLVSERPAPAPPTLNLRSLLDEMMRRGASDLHITAGERPKLRVDGSIVNSEVEDVLAAKDTLALTYSILTEIAEEAVRERGRAGLLIRHPEHVALPGQRLPQRGCVALAIRQVPFQIKSLEELQVPAVLGRLAERPRGLVLVTGPTGSGKSTTLAAMLDKINRERRGHILTIEDPIEFVHRHQGCMVNQREVGADTKSFSQALKYALRQDPDVILVGEMRDLETIQAALTIAETGHLCLATLHTNSAAESINRIIDVFPSHQQSQVRAQLAFVLEGVVTQTLLPKARGAGRVVATEVMVCTPADPRLHPRRQDPPDLLDHAGRQEARHADDERLALPGLHAARGQPRGLPQGDLRPRGVPADGRRADAG